MKALVVYDSVFGNTEQVAQAIGEALGAHGDAQVLRAADARPEQVTGMDVVVVGSPTRAFRPMPTVSGFVKSVPAGGLQGVRVAAFDTRIAVEQTGPAILRFLVRLFGYAAPSIAKGLQRKGGQLAAEPEGFIVGGTEGPLNEGELDRAREWGARLAAPTGANQ